MSEADLIRLLNEDREKLRAEVAELTQEANKLALQVTKLCNERDELRARIKAAVQFTITKRLRRTDGLLRILRGEEKP